MSTPKKEKKPKKEKIVYVSLGCEPESEALVMAVINYGAGYSKKKTKWYSYPIELSRLESCAAAYDYVIFEGMACYIG